MKNKTIVCGVDVFEKHYLPFLPLEESISNCVERLKKKPRGKQAPILSEDEQWRDFSVTPSASGLHEGPAFEPLTEIIEVISSQMEAVTPQRNKHHFRTCPSMPLPSSIEESSNMIDACLATHLKRKGKIPLNSIAVPLEFEVCRTQEKIMENHLQLLRAANQIMNEDPRRMFVYGITIEDSQMTLWYFSRSHSAKSESFDFLKEPRVLIRVFISLLFATDEALGYDQYVHLRRDGSYVYEFPRKPESFFFQTIEIVSETRSLCISGRAARVWKVRPVESVEGDRTGPDAVLKDLWLDKDTPTEKTLQERIFGKIEEFANSDWRKLPECDELGAEYVERLEGLLKAGAYRDLFLKIGEEYVGETSKSIPAGAWLYSELFDPAQSAEKPDSTSHQNTNPLLPIPDLLPKPTAAPRQFVQKTQSRFVFHEVCTALHNLKTVGDVMTVLRQAVDALLLLFCAGWVHRDISTGNILALRTTSGGWCVKLADLEYAKPYLFDTGSSDPKTGTPFFMPFEIQDQTLVRDMLARGFSDPYNFQSKPTPVLHNYQHDVESLWWIVLWVLTARVEHTPSMAYAARIFQNTLEVPVSRRQAFGIGLDNPYTEAYLTDAIFPEFQPFVRILEGFRRQLRGLYQSRPDQKDRRSFATVYRYAVTFFTMFDEHRDALQSVSLLQYSRQQAIPQDGQKVGPAILTANQQPERVLRKRLLAGTGDLTTRGDGPKYKKPRTGTAPVASLHHRRGTGQNSQAGGSSLRRVTRSGNAVPVSGAPSARSGYNQRRLRSMSKGN